MFLRTSLRAAARRRPQVAFLQAARSVSSAPLIRIAEGTFYRQYPTEDNAATNPPLYPKLNFELPSRSSPSDKSPLQHWAVVGTPGRTDLLDILRGQHICLPPNARSYPYLLSDEIAEKDPQLRYVGNAIQYIGFSGEGSGAIGGTRGAYLSARYESLREETDWTVEQFLRGQTSLNPLEGEENGTVRDEVFLKEVITDLRLSELLDMPVANLSNGQTRRARIAKALLQKPELLLLDEPLMGLDPATVRSISNLLHRLAEKQAPRLILALRPQDQVPDWITHIMVVGHKNQVLLQGPREDTQEMLKRWRQFVDGGSEPSSPAESEAFTNFEGHLASGALDNDLIQDLVPIGSTKPVKEREAPHGGEPVIEMDGVRVQYGDKVVLGDWTQQIHRQSEEGLYWRVRRGQRWAVLGANGSGKTTLVSLITSDHPQAYALPVKLLGRSRLPEPGKPGISIFELQSRLGHSSPEIHAFFPRQLSVRAALESAFADTFLSKPKLTVDRDRDVSAVLKFFKAELDPAAGTAEPPEISTADFPRPRMHVNGRKPRTMPPKEPYVPEEFYVEYADKLTFGQLTTAQQRIVLFLRALIHKPDIVILDEPFSGLSASQREKCLHFLDHGDAPYPSTPRQASNRKHRFPGLSEEQALIMISHVKEEIPDTVRHFMRLPSHSDDGEIDFRCGYLKWRSNLSDPAVWAHAWSSPAEFDDMTRRSFIRGSTQNKDQALLADLDKFEYFLV